MNKEENIIEELRELLKYGEYPDLSDLLEKSRSRLDISSTYGNILFAPLSTLEIYSPPKETAILNNLPDAKKLIILNSVLQIYPKKDNEPEVVEIIYRVDKALKNENPMNWNKVIFLAHASEDKPYVRKLYKILKDNGLEPWLDEENLMPGVRWDDKIKEAIKNSRFFMACLSNHSVSKNGYIQKELRMALNELEQKASDVIYFIPALIEDVSLPDVNVGTINLKDYQAVKIFNEDGMDRLINHLKQQANIIEEVKRKENPIFDNLRTTISEGQVETALRLLREYVEGRDDYMMNDVIMILSRYNNFKKQNMMGTISHEQYSMENSKIVYSILEMIKVLEVKEKNKK
ncbi:MAG: toll/interleukin-1 receptor domain-containing protein [Bacteroidetes Order II. Incertae sedis bacterium]|nr:toll/interleukin-1 receptor domain-containing protein [Bacteroidetes Order II. bacterium]